MDHPRKMNHKQVPIDQVVSWSKNPKNVKKADFERLKFQIKRLGVYRPLVVVQEKGRYVTLGGNSRLLALKKLGIKRVDVSIVEAETDLMKIEYALSDNDQVGEIDEQKLAELLAPHIEEISLDQYKVNTQEAQDLNHVIEMFSPAGEDDQDRLDRYVKSELVECPRCGNEFIPGDKDAGYELEGPEE